MTRALDVDEERLRLDAHGWCEVAVDGASGVRVDSPVYRAVTEGRDPGPRYSSCADLAHWMLYRMGVRMSLINRAEHLGWKVAENVARLAFSSHATAQVKHLTPQRGDVAIVWSKPQGVDAHVFVVDFCDDAAGVIHAWDYGMAAVNPLKWSPSQIEGARTEKRFDRIGGVITVGTRRLHRVISLPEIIAEAKRRGEWVEPESRASWRSRVLGDETPDTIPAPPPGDA